MCRAPSGEGARSTLVQRGPFRVDQCECGTIHVTLGAVTVRLLPLACVELAATLLEAAERLRQPGASSVAH